MDKYWFRGRSKKSKKPKWAFGFYVEFRGRSYILTKAHGECMGNMVLVEKETVGQYSEFNDVSAYPLYHGDVVKFLNNNDVAIVKFDNKLKSFILVPDLNGFYIKDRVPSSYKSIIVLEDCKVKKIGNVFDDQSLIPKNSKKWR